MTSFKRMTRGIKLLAEHIFDPITSALQTLTGTGVPVAQYEKELGTFRVSFNFPIANKVLWGTAAHRGKKSILTVPFILPPLQDQFEANETVIDGYELMEVSVSQDTRGEGAAIQTVVTGNEGYLDMGKAFAFDLSIQSKQKNPTGYDAFNNQVFSMSIPEVALINPYSRLNPHVQSGISIPFNHRDSYLLQVIPAPTKPTAYPTGVVNLFVTMKFKSKLRTRDLLGAAQNQTPKANRNFTAQAPVVPAGDSTIEADTPDGVNTGFKLIDSFIDRRLRGGYKKSALSYAKEGLAADAAYDVIAVPMFGSWPHVSGGTRLGGFEVGNDLPYETLPWVALSSSKYETIDRALIPINYPLAIHHVIIASNYTGGSGEVTARPTNAVAPSYKNEVGVGILSGHRADNIKVQQVAYVDWLPSTRDSKTIDRGDYNNLSPGGSTPQTTGYSWDLINCPISGNTSGKGYTAQGTPMFVAAGINDTASRTNVGAATPLTVGAEQVLDIRWKISNGTANPASWSSRSSILGYGGHWVYLICKKTVI
jgi:hypothetical protein